MSKLRWVWPGYFADTMVLDDCVPVLRRELQDRILGIWGFWKILFEKKMKKLFTFIKNGVILITFKMTSRMDYMSDNDNENNEKKIEYGFCEENTKTGASKGGVRDEKSI